MSRPGQTTSGSSPHNKAGSPCGHNGHSIYVSEDTVSSQWKFLADIESASDTEQSEFEEEIDQLGPDISIPQTPISVKNPEWPKVKLQSKSEAINQLQLLHGPKPKLLQDSTKRQSLSVQKIATMTQNQVKKIDSVEAQSKDATTDVTDVTCGQSSFPSSTMLPSTSSAHIHHSPPVTSLLSFNTLNPDSLRPMPQFPYAIPLQKNSDGTLAPLYLTSNQPSPTLEVSILPQGPTGLAVEVSQQVNSGPFPEGITQEMLSGQPDTAGKPTILGLHNTGPVAEGNPPSSLPRSTDHAYSPKAHGTTPPAVAQHAKTQEGNTMLQPPRATSTSIVDYFTKRQTHSKLGAFHSRHSSTAVHANITDRGVDSVGSTVDTAIEVDGSAESTVTSQPATGATTRAHSPALPARGGLISSTVTSRPIALPAHLGERIGPPGAARNRVCGVKDKDNNLCTLTDWEIEDLFCVDVAPVRMCKARLAKGRGEAQTDSVEVMNWKTIEIMKRNAMASVMARRRRLDPVKTEGGTAALHKSLASVVVEVAASQMVDIAPPVKKRTAEQLYRDGVVDVFGTVDVPWQHFSRRKGRATTNKTKGQRILVDRDEDSEDSTNEGDQDSVGMSTSAEMDVDNEGEKNVTVARLKSSRLRPRPELGSRTNSQTSIPRRVTVLKPSKPLSKQAKPDIQPNPKPGPSLLGKRPRQIVEDEDETSADELALGSDHVGPSLDQVIMRAQRSNAVAHKRLHHASTSNQASSSKPSGYGAGNSAPGPSSTNAVRDRASSTSNAKRRKVAAADGTEQSVGARKIVNGKGLTLDSFFATNQKRVNAPSRPALASITPMRKPQQNGTGAPSTAKPSSGTPGATSSTATPSRKTRNSVVEVNLSAENIELWTRMVTRLVKGKTMASPEEQTELKDVLKYIHSLIMKGDDNAIQTLSDTDFVEALSSLAQLEKVNIPGNDGEGLIAIAKRVAKGIPTTSDDGNKSVEL